MAYNYLVGIGGTGQRVLRSFVNACHMNLVFDEGGTPLKDVRALVIDKDNNSGNGADGDFHHYETLDNDPLSRTNITYLGMWEPKPTTEARHGVRQPVQQLDILAAGDEESEKLMEALFDGYERDKLAKKGDSGGFSDGFKGHPNVGATYQSVAIHEGAGRTDSEVGKFIESLKSELQQGNECRVFIVASLFGGTGASGLPMLVQQLRKNCPDGREDGLKIGAGMMLPYFMYEKPVGSQLDNIRLDAANTQTIDALNYYQDEGYMNANHPTRFINNAYLLGLENKAFVGAYCEGGADQKNRAVFLELTCAMSARHFFTQPQISPEAAAWAIGFDASEINGALNLPFSILSATQSSKDIFERKLRQGIRFVMYAQLFVYWGIVNWDNSLLPDKNTMEWLKRMPHLVKIVERRETGTDTERSAFIDQLNKISERNIALLNWICELLEFEGLDNTAPGFGFSTLSGNDLTKLIDFNKQLSEAARRHDGDVIKKVNLERMKKLFGTPTSRQQEQWADQFDRFWSKDGPQPYSGKIVKKLLESDLRDKSIVDVLTLIYELCNN